jgi:hypothetical protein
VCSWGFVVSVCAKNVTLGAGLSSILLIDGALLRTSPLCWEGVSHESKQREGLGWAQSPLGWADKRVSGPAVGKKVAAARDIVAVGGGAKKGLTSDGRVYNVFT